MTEQTGTDWVTTTTGRSASSYELGLSDMFEKELVNIIVATLIDDLSKKFTRGL